MQNNLFFWAMAINFSALSYQQKLRWIEVLYFMLMSIIIPFFMGLQVFNHFSHVLSLVLLEVMNAPLLYLFYKVYLEQILFKKRWLLSILLLPVYLVIYELYRRLMMIAMINFPFIPISYRKALQSGRPDDFTSIHQTIGYTCFILLALFALSIIKRLFEKQHELLEMQYDKVKLELENLRAQVNPHFFFNTLNNLYHLSLQSSPKAPELIAKLSAIMRYVIYESEQKVPLTKEIEFMENYFELERIRHTAANLIDFRIQGDPSALEIEPLMFLPLIENCFKHGLQKDVLESPIKIVLVIDADELVFQTSNKIIENETDRILGGIGLANVKKRLKLLYGDKQELIITKELGYYTATVNIQL